MNTNVSVIGIKNGVEHDLGKVPEWAAPGFKMKDIIGSYFGHDFAPESDGEMALVAMEEFLTWYLKDRGLKTWAEQLAAELAATSAMPAANEQRGDMDAEHWAELIRLRGEAEGPDGFATWKEAALNERARRVAAEHLAAQATAEATHPISLELIRSLQDTLIFLGVSVDDGGSAEHFAARLEDNLYTLCREARTAVTRKVADAVEKPSDLPGGDS